MTEDQEKRLLDETCARMASELSLGEGLTIIRQAIDQAAKESLAKLSDEEKQEFFKRVFQEKEVE
jgi:hypothetical protein